MKSIKFFKVTVLCMMILISFSIIANAIEFGDYGVLKYKVNDDNTVEIESCKTNVTNVQIPSSINGKIVTKIGNSAFVDCNKLINLTIPNTITQIDCTAFGNIPWYQNQVKKSTNGLVIIGDGILFDGKLAKGNVVIPNNVKIISAEAFYNNNQINSVTIPYSVTKIEENAFSSCTSLLNVNITSNPIVEAKAFLNTPWLNNLKQASVNGLVVVGDGVLIDGENATGNVIIPNNVKRIANMAFNNNNNIYSVIMTDNVLYLGKYAFSNNKNLINVTISNNIGTISEGAFYGCEKLTNVTFPNRLEAIDKSAFERCISLKNLYLPNTITSISNLAFYGCAYLENVSLPSSLKEINEYTFAECARLNTIYIPSSVKKIGLYAFKNCTNLTTVSIEEGLENIGQYAFEGCIYLNKINIPNTLNTIGKGAFYLCGNLEKIELLNNVTKIDSYAFDDCARLSIAGYINSAAYYYAKDNNIPFIKLGAVWSNASSWAISELTNVKENNLIPACLLETDFTKNITRAEFAAIVVKLYENITNEYVNTIENPFIDTDNLEILKAYTLGITYGTSSNKFSPNELINREQMATMMTRAIEKINPSKVVSSNIYRENNLNKFTDDILISDWAYSSIYFMFNNNIINGIGDNMFGAKNNATREQALLIANRCFNEYKY